MNPPQVRHFDAVDVIIQTTPASPEINQWLEAPGLIEVELSAVTIRWRPGRAVLEGPADTCEKLIPALVAFSYLESELRRLEQALLPYEVSASEHVPYAYVIRSADRSHWPRIRQTMENLSRLRLSFAQLDPAVPKSMKKLLVRSGVPARMELFDTRLEACEDLYEGAVDRIADFRWYRHGELLEIAILALLALELIATLWSKAWPASF